MTRTTSTSLNASFNKEFDRLKMDMMTKITEVRDLFMSRLDELENELSETNKKLDQLSSENSTLKNSIEKLEGKFISYERRFGESYDHLDQKIHSMSIVLSGPVVNGTIHALRKNNPDLVSHKIPYDAADAIFNDILEIKSGVYTILNAQRLGHRTNGPVDNRPLLVTLDDMPAKHTIFKAAVSKKAPGLSINEYLTGHRRILLNNLLQLRKTKPEIGINVYTYNGTVHAKIRDTDKRWTFKNQQDVDSFVRELCIAT